MRFHDRRVLACAGLLLAIATACGAMGAHALRHVLAPDRLQLWETAVRYQFLQGLGLLGVGLTPAGRSGRTLAVVAALLLGGTIVFCGSLFGLSLGAPRTLGMLTPLGGAAWITGWLVYAWALWRN